jgi:hypothetical protein
MPRSEEEVIKLSIKPKTVKAKKLSDLKPTKDAKGGCRKSGGNALQGVITSAKKTPSVGP